MRAFLYAYTAVLLLQCATATPAKSIGIVGVGTIGSAVVRGVLTATLGFPEKPKFVLSPRDATKAAALKQQFPHNVDIAASDQSVVDLSDVVVIALPGSVAEQVIKGLHFRTEQQVVSLVAAIKLASLQELLGPHVECAMALPMPAIAKQQGATLGIPAKPWVEAIFGPLGSYIPVSDQEQFERMAAAGSFMGDFYKRQFTIQRWLTAHGAEADKAAQYIGAMFGAFAADSRDAGPTTFEDLVRAQTPGGLNEMVWREQAAAGVYLAMNKSLDSVYARNNNSTL